MPKKIYIVQRTVGSSYESSTYNECAFFDKGKAEAEKARLEKLEKTFEKICKAGEKFNEQYNETHPLPEFEDRLVKHKWPAGLHMDQITPEMRAERDHIEKHNKEVDARNLERENQYCEARSVAAKQFLLDKGYDSTLVENAVHHGFMVWENPTYDIEELDILDATDDQTEE